MPYTPPQTWRESLINPLTGRRHVWLHTDRLCPQMWEYSTVDGPFLPGVAKQTPGAEACVACAPNLGAHHESWASIALPRNFHPGRRR